MNSIPFLRASIVPVNEYLGELEKIDISHIYTNYGPLNQHFEEKLCRNFSIVKGLLQQ